MCQIMLVDQHNILYFNPHHKAMIYFISTCIMRKNQSIDRLTVLPKVTKLVNDKAEILTLSHF